MLNLTLVLLGQSTSTSQFVVEERDELIARLQETERKLREKTSRVSELEQNLEEVGLTMLYCTCTYFSGVCRCMQKSPQWFGFEPNTALLVNTCFMQS